MRATIWRVVDSVRFHSSAFPSASRSSLRRSIASMSLSWTMRWMRACSSAASGTGALGAAGAGVGVWAREPVPCTCSTPRTKSPTPILSVAEIFSGTTSRLPFRKVPLRLFRPSTKTFPSSTAMRRCFFETLPRGRQTSLSSPLPTVTSWESKDSRRVAPSFPVMAMQSPIGASVEQAEGHGALGIPVEPAGLVDEALGPLRARGGDPRRHVDGQLGLVLDEVPALEELSENGDVAEERDLRDLLALGVVVEPGEDDGLAVLDGDAGLHV